MFTRHENLKSPQIKNEPQDAFEQFEKFAKSYEFSHNIRLSQSIGLAKWMVKTVKQVFQHSTDLSLSLLTYRTPPLNWCNLIPAELLMRILMSRKLGLTYLLPRHSYCLNGDISQTFRMLTHHSNNDRNVIMTNDTEYEP